MKSIQDQYNLIKEGKGHKDVFLKSIKRIFPNAIPNHFNYEQALPVLLGRRIILEKAEDPKTQKNIKDFKVPLGFNPGDLDNIDNLYRSSFLDAFYTEAQDPDNKDKSVDELKAIVAKNIRKNPYHYIKNGQFGDKRVGYSDDQPGLKASDTDQMTPVPGAKKIKASLTSLGTQEAPKGMPKKVKTMTMDAQSSKGVQKMPTPSQKHKKVRISLKEMLEEGSLSKSGKISIIRNFINSPDSRQDHKDELNKYLAKVGYELGGFENDKEILASLDDTKLTKLFNWVKRRQPEPANMMEGNSEINNLLSRREELLDEMNKDYSDEGNVTDEFREELDKIDDQLQKLGYDFSSEKKAYFWNENTGVNEGFLGHSEDEEKATATSKFPYEIGDIINIKSNIEFPGGKYELINYKEVGPTKFTTGESYVTLKNTETGEEVNTEIDFLLGIGFHDGFGSQIIKEYYGRGMGRDREWGEERNADYRDSFDDIERKDMKKSEAIKIDDDYYVSEEYGTYYVLGNNSKFAYESYADKNEAEDAAKERRSELGDLKESFKNYLGYNDPVIMKSRASKYQASFPKPTKAKDNTKKIQALLDKRYELIQDMEQEAEPEGGSIADQYGDQLDRIDLALEKLGYDQWNINEDRKYDPLNDSWSDGGKFLNKPTKSLTYFYDANEVKRKKELIDQLGKDGFWKEYKFLQDGTGKDNSRIIDVMYDKYFMGGTDIDEEQEPSADQEAKEHSRTYYNLQKDVNVDGKLDMSKKQFGQSIRKDHELKEEDGMEYSSKNAFKELKNK